MPCEEQMKLDKTSKLVRMYTRDYEWLEAYAHRARLPVTEVIHKVFDRIRREFGYSFLMKGC